MEMRLSRLALSDIENIYDYTQTQWGQAQAVKYVGSLWQVLREIQDAPTLWRRRPDIHRDARVRVHGRHIIIYRCIDTEVEVSRILHGSRMIADHLPPGFID
jgi:toxin ParE1/3/4